MFRLIAQSPMKGGKTLCPTAHKPFTSITEAVNFGKGNFRALPWSVCRAEDKDDKPIIALQQPEKHIADQFAAH